MPDTTTTIVGNLTDDPELRLTEAGIARVRTLFRTFLARRRPEQITERPL